ncbi:hypothetical protein CDAR_370791 [Caerostris darwini]|uniref:Uncharacterized protein n=1 Tax=Caerostris darwini TaxID=1538125 RepID=A0AAV4VIC7_9ARAC|nr:hypothetical protein CDAR_370791 [Caerostris darwini]
MHSVEAPTPAPEKRGASPEKMKLWALHSSRPLLKTRQFSFIIFRGKSPSKIHSLLELGAQNACQQSRKINDVEECLCGVRGFGLFVIESGNFNDAPQSE